MNILIDIGHPAHVHITKHFAHEMEAKGNAVLFTCRQKEFIIQLLEAEGFKYEVFGKKYETTLKKIWGMVKFDLQLLKTCLRFKPDMFLSAGSMYAAQVAALMRKPHISFEDTYNMEQVRLYLPFTALVLTGDYEHPTLSETKEFRMAGYNELAYLHPKRFTPDERVLDELGVKKDEKFIIVRFVNANATHDSGLHIATVAEKIEIIKQLAKKTKVFLSSEVDFSDELKPYKFRLSPEKMHSAIAFSSLVISESATMCEEAAVLGVPNVLYQYRPIYYTDHLAKDYGLIKIFQHQSDKLENLMKFVDELLVSDALKNEWEKRLQKMLSEKIDVTSFLEWIVENYPQSLKELHDNPKIQYNFR